VPGQPLSIQWRLPRQLHLKGGSEVMLLVYSRNWWTLAIRGVAAIIFGLFAFVWPGITLLVLVFLFGAYAFVDGVFAIVAGIRAREHQRWWLLLIEGILSVIAGIMAFAVPGITAIALLVLIATWAIVTGILEVIAAIQMRKYITNEWLLALGAIASVVFGVLLLLRPAIGALAVLWLIGAYAIFFGIMLLALGFRLRSLERTTHAQMHPKPV
jgi:uncharacterized membrane protein HdeD (DUF308 family)